MKFLLFLALFGTAPALHAAEIAYVPLQLCGHHPYQSYRDYWDRAGKFCANGGNYDMTAMPEIKLREKGLWADNEYASSLSPANRAVVEQYKTYYVRYFAARPAMNGKIEFVVHVYFNWGPGTQTIFVFGEIENEKIKITGYSNSKASEGHLRAAYNTVTNLLAVFNGENPNRAGVTQTKSEDRERIQPVTDVIRKFGRPETELIRR